ncbi:MAG: 1-deoxy-D-xylulose-5-phosphate synthase [Oscillospiraceae bacterium]|jgi:1-deoxy-D-xylulose-5-phosphate synthase|nr:1-deoxy-D-xylulose-5-phosphate synthase [Oscillospiraceae bacterium]
MNFLDNIRSSKDVKGLKLKQLPQLCKEIRLKLIRTIAQNGGHLASNLGVVELTVALHYVFNIPIDQIVWDVGHQCYTHKILTGRQEKFGTIRIENGISGFPKRSESKCDPFGTGHSSTSISAALGLFEAKKLSSKFGHVIAVIGDGALSGGLAYEGLNNAGRLNKNFIVILNDNKMSISKNVGSMARYLSNIRTLPYYLKAKGNIENAILGIPGVGKKLRDLIFKSKAILKNALYEGTLFEDMGFVYYGPVNGHNLADLIKVFSAVKQIDKPIFVHVNTIKGKGYYFAEQDPKTFHSVAKFNVKTGDGDIASGDFSEEFGKQLCTIASKDNKICAITAAMTNSTGLLDFSRKFQNRFYDVGIAEGHAITFSAGLAAGGCLPVFAVYSSFLQRGYDQIIHDAATQNLHIIIAIDRAGVVGEDGETHQGVFDSAFLNPIPNVTVYAPTFFDELRSMLYLSLYKCDGVVALRYPKGKEPQKPENFLSDGRAPFYVYGDINKKNAIITYGRLFSYACAAKKRLAKHGVDVCIIKINRIKPIDTSIFKVIKNFNLISFFEEGIMCGGIGEHLGYMLKEQEYNGNYYVHAIENCFIPQASVTKTLHNLGLDEDGIFNQFMADVKKIKL